MSIVLLQAIVTAAEALTEGYVFGSEQADKNIEYYIGSMPGRGPAPVFPFCLAKLRSFNLHPGARSQDIDLVYGIFYNRREDAMDGLNTLSGLIEPLAIRGTGLPIGWKMMSAGGYSGEKETGLQPHPEYYLTVSLSFSGPPLHR